LITPRERFIAFRRSRPRSPRLIRRAVRARGLEFAVYFSPEVPGATPLVCVNGGLLFDHNLLWPALAPLADRRQLILYDQRGRGASQVPPGARTARIEHDAGDLPALREAIGIAQWDVLGHSWGGGLAMLATERDRAAVRRLVLVDSVGPVGNWQEHLLRDALPRLDAGDRAILEHIDLNALLAPEPGVHSAYSRAMYAAWFADPTLAEMFSPPRSESQTGAAVASQLRGQGYDWTALLRAVSVPTLVIHGDRDLLPVSVAHEIVATLGNARLEIIPDAGHMPFWESPELFFALTESFLSTPTS
jgi:proline iminopeptidase